ncbi:MAG: putative sulfate/molybdate transporter [Alphaproteobacteria bacterium]
MEVSKGHDFTVNLRELNGALADLGTLLPLVLGTIVVAGLPPVPVLLGFAVFYIASALYYRLPVPVQPMKAVAAVILTAPVAAGSIMASGVMIGVLLLVLGLTGWLGRLARLVPQSVLSGLQLGLGVALMLVGFSLMATAPVIAGVTLMLLVGLMLAPRVPSVPIALAAAIGLAHWLGVAGIGAGSGFPDALVLPSLPSVTDLTEAFSLLVLPQLPLTFTNAVLLTALVAGDCFGDRAAHVTPARLSVTSGLANILLTPFGALPMCHGAGGLAAHHRFGARSGTAPLLLGLALLVLALLPGGGGLALLGAVPAAGLGALLMLASAQLALNRRLFDSRLSCWPVIAATAAVTIWIDPFWGLLAGAAAEVIRSVAVRLWLRRATAGPKAG